MKPKLLLLFLLAGGSLLAGTHVSFGVSVGGPRGYYAAPPPPPPAVGYFAPRPGRGYVWIDGYWYRARGRYLWRPGYWVRPPHPRARWIPPRYRGHYYYHGYWR
ncbi:MAG: hypothetical protein EHM65_05280 [Acidobacteriales bacterium]|nr:MAG: hypothetical protein EHM65_05280 [Terriglobales bacterium]